jgi:hypothetical protein
MCRRDCGDWKLYSINNMLSDVIDMMFPGVIREKKLDEERLAKLIESLEKEIGVDDLRKTWNDNIERLVSSSHPNEIIDLLRQVDEFIFEHRYDISCAGVILKIEMNKLYIAYTSGAEGSLYNYENTDDMYAEFLALKNINLSPVHASAEDLILLWISKAREMTNDNINEFIRVPLSQVARDTALNFDIMGNKGMFRKLKFVKKSLSKDEWHNMPIYPGGEVFVKFKKTIFNIDTAINSYSNMSSIDHAQLNEMLDSFSLLYTEAKKVRDDRIEFYVEWRRDNPRPTRETRARNDSTMSLTE